LVLAWALAAVGEIIGLRWILWNEEGEMPQEVFEEMMAIIERMLGGKNFEAGTSRIGLETVADKSNGES
jgi:hypothetical protein